MRILAIRGRNLASLAGDFEVNLGAPPISEVGLFAISGPTGSGKTTLLDALCLALFDRTPRLSDRGGVWVGLAGDGDAMRIASQDVRSLLRKGTPSGYAEVDFSGRDGRGYRARWAVRRARDRADGALQKQTMTLHELGLPQPIGRTKVEVLAAIEGRLGLSFEQFRRSALLAQGDFAAFLGADERARAELLEQMTGTWIYGEVSARAYERHREEASSLQESEARCGELRLLGAAEREALGDELAAAEGDAARHRAALLAAEQARAHWLVLGSLREQEAEATRRREEAARAADAVAGLREELARLDLAMQLRSSLSLFDAASGAVTDEGRGLSARELEASTLAELEVAALDRWRSSELRLDERRAALAAQSPVLERATGLDASIRSHQELAEEGAREAAAARVEASAADLEARDGSALLARAAAARSLAERELGLRHASASLSAEWEGVRLELARYVKATSALEKLDHAGAASSAMLAAEARGRAAQALDAAAARAAHADSEATEAARGISVEEPGKLRAEKERVLRREVVVAALIKSRSDALTLRAAAEEASGAAQQARFEGEDAAAAAEEATRAAAQIDRALESSHAALRDARAAHDLAAYREALAAGEPCPLCGATEHPWASAEPPFASRLESEEERNRQLLSSRSHEDRAAATARARVLERRERADDQERRAAGLRAQLAVIEASWQEGRLELGAAAALPESASAAGAAEALDATRGETLAALGRVRAAEEDADRGARSLSAARRASDEARREVEGLREQASRARDAAEAAASALARIDEETGRHRAAQLASIEAVTSVFEGRGGWRERLIEDGRAFGLACLGEVNAYRAARQAFEEASLQMVALSPRSEAAARRARDRDDFAASREAQAAARASALAGLRAERGALLGGERTEQVSARLHAAVTSAEREERLAHADHEAADKAAARAATALDGARRVLAEKQATFGLAAEALREGLASRGLSEEALRALLARDEGWRRSRSHEVARLELEVERSEAVLLERAARRREHERAAPPSLEPARVEESAAASRAALEQAEEQAASRKLRLRDDDREREKATTLAAQIAQKQSRVELWASLSQLIGSADGKKFRVFAQSLTFDSLIYLANVHLDELARRYQLMRVPRSDLDLQVIDREMADEARSVSSLSGGETFLVSLALALGLSSLGSRDTRVETLFIDEGFGTLDPESLEVALSSLDALQSSGRKVGLISHVPGLSERLGVQVKVQPRGAGRSIVTTVG